MQIIWWFRICIYLFSLFYVWAESRSMWLQPSYNPLRPRPLGSVASPLWPYFEPWLTGNTVPQGTMGKHSCCHGCYFRAWKRNQIDSFSLLKAIRICREWWYLRLTDITGINQAFGCPSLLPVCWLYLFSPVSVCLIKDITSPYKTCLGCNHRPL